MYILQLFVTTYNIILNQIQMKTMHAGEFPGDELINGALILIAGALLLTPGFFTDILGFFFVFSYSREIIKKIVKKYLKKKLNPDEIDITIS